MVIEEGFSTTVRNIGAMQVVILYEPKLMHTMQIKQDGESIFCFSPCHRPVEQGWPHLLDAGKLIDPFTLRDDFFSVTDERKAVEFLCQCGIFYSGRNLPWSDFVRWQRFATLITERTELVTAAVRLRSGEERTVVDPKNEYIPTIEMTQGHYVAFFKNAGVSQKECDYQVRVQNWFTSPPYEAYSIQFVPDGSDNVSQQLMPPAINIFDPSNFCQAIKATEKHIDSRNTIFMDNIEKSSPVLVVRAWTALEAIAAAAYADRISKVHVVQCKGCSKLFSLDSGRKKLYHDELCKDRHKKSKRRKKSNLDS